MREPARSGEAGRPLDRPCVGGRGYGREQTEAGRGTPRYSFHPCVAVPEGGAHFQDLTLPV